MPPFSSDVALACEIVQLLNDRDWMLSFVAERTWLPEWTIKGGELDTLRVSVNPWIEPGGLLTERPDSDEDDPGEVKPQSGMWSTWPIDVTVCQRLTNQSLEQFDQLADLVEQLRQYLCPQGIGLDDGRQFHSLEFSYLARFDPSLINRVVSKGIVRYTGVFLSAFRVQFREMR